MDPPHERPSTSRLYSGVVRKIAKVASSSIMVKCTLGVHTNRVVDDVQLLRYNDRESTTPNSNNSSSSDEGPEISSSTLESTSWIIDLKPLQELTLTGRTIKMILNEMKASEDALNHDSNITKCSICIEEYNFTHESKKPIFLECFHTLCRDCLDQTLQMRSMHRMCPLCRVFVNMKNNFQVNFYMEELLNYRRIWSANKLLWCKDCMKIAKGGCDNHKAEIILEQFLEQWKKKKLLFESLKNECEKLKRCYTLSKKNFAKEFNAMVLLLGNSIKYIRGVKRVFLRLLDRKRKICSQLKTIQTELDRIEPKIQKIEWFILNDEDFETDESSSSRVYEASTSRIDEAATSLVDEATSSRIDEATYFRIDEAISSRMDETTSSIIDEATSSRIGEATSLGINEASSSRIDQPCSSRMNEASSSIIDEATYFGIDEAISSQIYEASSSGIDQPSSSRIDEATFSRTDDAFSSSSVKNESLPNEREKKLLIIKNLSAEKKVRISKIMEATGTILEDIQEYLMIVDANRGALNSSLKEVDVFQVQMFVRQNLCRTKDMETLFNHFDVMLKLD